MNGHVDPDTAAVLEFFETSTRKPLDAEAGAGAHLAETTFDDWLSQSS
jgi:hypothetical protein